MKIFLLGFMGSGKSHTGKELAGLLKIPFIDLDENIIRAAGKSISAIFEAEGEAAFRQRERDALRALAKVEYAVVSTGGGTPCFFDNLDWMKKNGLTIYLEASIPVLLARLTREMDQRPLLRALSREELAAFIGEKLEERNPYYRQASVIYQQTTGEEKVAQELAESFKGIIGD